MGSYRVTRNIGVSGQRTARRTIYHKT